MKSVYLWKISITFVREISILFDKHQTICGVWFHGIHCRLNKIDK